MSIKDSQGLPIDKFDYVRVPFPEDYPYATADEEAAIVRIVGISDGLRKVTCKGAFVSLAGNNGRVATFLFDPAYSTLVARATGQLVTAAKVLPVEGKVGK